MTISGDVWLLPDDARRAVAQEFSTQQEDHFSTKRPGISSSVNFELFSRLLPEPGSKILDIGCNGGHVTMRLREMGYDACGVDLPAVIKHALEYFPGAQAYLTALNLEFDELPGSDYDLVLALGVMEHLVYGDRLVEKIGRVIKIGGVLYLTTCDRSVRESEIWHARHYTREELVEMAERARFEVVEIYRPGGEASLAGVFRKWPGF